MRACTLCDSPCEADEALCAACLTDPDKRSTGDAIARAARQARARERWFVAAREAIRMARAYHEEGGADDPRARACVEEAKRCRDTIRAMRRGERASLLPGLRKAGLPAHAVKNGKVA